jgi:ferritin
MPTVTFKEADTFSFVTDGRTIEDMLQEQVGWEQVSSLVCDDLSNMFQAMGFHGFKRHERYEARGEAEEARCLRKLIYDVSVARTTVDITYSALPASATLRVILGWKQTWYEGNLSRLSSMLTIATSTGKWQYVPWLQEAIECQGKKIKNLAKLIQNITIAGWDNGHHLLMINAKMHKKFKLKEKKIGYDID